MPDKTPERFLARRYRRLLRAYPRWHRRLHGADMLTVLLDAAADRPASRAAGIRQALTLVLDGIRCRLRVRGAGPRILAAALSLIGAGTLAAAAGWVGWQAAAAPWPSVDQATALAAPVLPAGAPDLVTRRDDPIGPWLSDADSVVLTLLGSPELRPGGVHLQYVRPHTTDVAAVYAAAVTDLPSSGWRASVVRGLLVAERDGLRLTLLYSGRDVGTDDVLVAVYPAPPPTAYRLGWLGAVAGGLLGWLVAAGAIARGRCTSPARRTAAIVLAVSGAAASVPAGLLNFVGLAGAGADPDAVPPWVGYQFVLARPAAVAGGLLLATALLLSTGRTPIRPVATAIRRPGAA